MQGKFRNLGMILVAIDGSPNSLSAAKMAVQIAQTTHQMVHGLYVVESGLIAGNQNSLSQPALLIDLEAAGNQALHMLRSECDISGVPVITEIVIGSVPETIQQKADQSIFLTVGRRGQGHPQGSEFLGDNFRPICHMINKPILVGGEIEPSIQRILLTVPDESSYQKSIETVSSFSKSLLGVNSQPENQFSSPKSGHDSGNPSGRELAYNPFSKLVSRSAAEIAAESRGRHTDLLILAGYPRITPLGWLEGNLPEQVIRKVMIPAIIL